MSEIAWDHQGRYCGDKAPRLHSKPASKDRSRYKRGRDNGKYVAHQCGGRDSHGIMRTRDRSCGAFVCSRCGRVYPWCWGGEGTLCDPCWVEVDEQKKEQKER